MRTITAPPGLGDNIWLIQKLINSGEKFNFILPDGSPRRGKALFDLLPQITNSCDYAPGLSYKRISRDNIFNTKKKWKEIREESFTLCANGWLENGYRIEGFLQDLPTAYKLDYHTSDDDKLDAEILLPEGKKYIGIYGSAYKNARHAHYNGWGPEEWFDLIQSIYYVNLEIAFVIIGAEYDEDLALMLMGSLREADVSFVNTIGQPLSVVVEMLKRLSYFIGFPSGLSILNETLGKNGLMFYGTSQKGIINTWADPERIKNGSIKECLFCEPQKIFDWLKNDYKLFDKL